MLDWIKKKISNSYTGFDTYSHIAQDAARTGQINVLNWLSQKNMLEDRLFCNDPGLRGIVKGALEDKKFPKIEVFPDFNITSSIQYDIPLYVLQWL